MCEVQNIFHVDNILCCISNVITKGYCIQCGVQCSVQSRVERSGVEYSTLYSFLSIQSGEQSVDWVVEKNVRAESVEENSERMYYIIYTRWNQYILYVLYFILCGVGVQECIEQSRVAQSTLHSTVPHPTLNRVKSRV